VGCKADFRLASTFLAAAFRRDRPEEYFESGDYVIVGWKLKEDDPEGGYFLQRAYAPHPRFDAIVRQSSAYYCPTTTSAVPQPDGRVSRKNVELCRTYVIVADDVGTKVDVGLVWRLLPPPTYVLETSRGNFQYGWVLSEPVSAVIAGNFYRGMKECGLTDGGSAKVGQPFRLPGSLHRSGWNASLRLWRDRVDWSEMTRCVPLIERRVGRFDYDEGWNDYQPGDERRDLIYQQLKQRGLLRGPVGHDGWVKVICPGWRDHSDGKRIAGYRVASGFDEGAFHCFHEHCAGRGLGDLMCWLGRTQP